MKQSSSSRQDKLCSKRGAIPAATLALIFLTGCGGPAATFTPPPAPTVLVIVGPSTEYIATLSTTSPALTPVSLTPAAGNTYMVDATNRYLISLQYFPGTPSNYYACGADNVHTFAVSPSDGSRTEIASPAITSQLLLPDIQGRFLFDMHCVYNPVMRGDFTTFSSPLGVDVWTVSGNQFTPVAGSPFGDGSAILAEDPGGAFLYVMGASGIEALSIGADGTLKQRSLTAVSFAPQQMVFHPSGRNAYVTSVPDPLSGFTTIDVYTVSKQDGSLTLQSSTTDTTSPDMLIAMHPSGNFVYGFNGTNIVKFPVDSSGNLQSPTVTPNVNVGDMVFNKAGTFAFASQGYPSYLGMFSVNIATGDLTGIAQSPPSADAGFYVYVMQ